MERIIAFFSHIGHTLRPLVATANRQPLRYYGLAVAGFVGVALIGWLIVAWWGSEEFSDTDRVDPAYAAYIEHHTGGVISSETPLTIRFYQLVVDSSALREAINDDWFHFKPSIAGSAYWVDPQTITFIPEKPWQSGQRYQVKFELDEVLDVPEQYRNFEFSLQTMHQNYSLEVVGLEPVSDTDYAQQQLRGTLLTADVAEASAVETMLTASQHGAVDLEVVWDHAADQRTHHFTVQNIVRQDSSRTVQLISHGAPIVVADTQQQIVQVPALREFVLLDHRTVEEPEQYVELRFSDPLLPDQSLEGLIQLDGKDEVLRFISDNNTVRVYPGERLIGTATLTVDEGIKNTHEDRLGTSSELELNFEPLKPAVRPIGQGVILPSTDGMVLPFEAVNLREVDVTVIKVYEDNLPQFLQTNALDGDQEIRHVGRPVAQQAVPLNGVGVTDLGRWNRFTLDLSDIVQIDPGALYRIIIGFRQHQSVLPCLTADSTFATQNVASKPWTDDWDNATQGYWEAYSDYYYAAEFNWEERDDPCTPSYYGSRRSVQKNLIVSDLGLIAKRGMTVAKQSDAGESQGESQLLHVAVTDLTTTQPREGVTVRLYDFQQRELVSQTTNDEGWATFAPPRTPFLAVAEDEQQRGYLRLEDGASLSLSNFDVSGQQVPNGLKGFLYGDRGVWRPGDSLHVNFILEDPENTLPEYYPVIFQLQDPRGRMVQRIVQNRSVGGIYNFSTTTPAEAPTGTWTGKVQVGGTTFTKPLRIETIKPNRLKIELDFDRDKFTARNRRPTGTLDVAWLSGATARNLRAQFDLLLTPTPISFDSYPNYVFSDPSRTLGSERKEVFNERIDSEGHAEFALDLTLDQRPPGLLNATFIGKVFEEGGNFSTDQQTLPYYPYRAFVGLRAPEGDGWNGALTTGEAHTIDIAVVDADGEPIGRDELEVTLYKLDWQWWWDQSDSNLSNYVNSEYQQPMQQATVAADSGRATWHLTVPNEDWGRYYLRVCDPESGHCAGTVTYLDWPGYAGSDAPSSQGATMLTFTTDQEKYTVGEAAMVRIPGSPGSRALVSLENGSQVLQKHWVTMEDDQPETAFSFEVTEAMAPNVYIHVTLLQPHTQTTNDLPIRLYGLLNVPVENPSTYLQPVISMPEKVAPKSTVSLRITEAQQQPMAYTVAVVDEGLLDITRFATPDPHAYFYAREALGVKTWDLYDAVIGAYGGSLERLLSVGGDGAAPLGPQSRETNRFAPVVQFMGPYFLEAGETNEHAFTMPNYVGSVRIMVVAAYEGAYGHADTTMRVSQPLMVLATLPRTLSPGETIQLPVDVFALEHTVKNARVNVATDELLTVTGESSQDVYFGTIGDEVIDFQLKVGESTGVGQVQINAAAGPVRANHEINIPITNPNTTQVETVSQLIRPGDQWNTTLEPFGTAGTNTATLEVSSIPPINLGRRLAYLVNYPHGCVEQVISAAFPQLFLSSIADLSEARQATLEGYVKAAIRKLGAFRTNEGAFAYWEGENDADEWCTNYAGHFLLEAQQQGYTVPVGLLSGWISYQNQRARQWGGSRQNERGDLTQAYRLYTLALAGQPATGAMNRMRERGTLSLTAHWRLAAAYALVGQTETAQQMIQNQDDDVPAYRETYGTYGSELRDEAMILETLALLNRREQGLSLFRRISSALSDDNRWMSTQTTAYCLVAATKFAATLSLDDEINARYQTNTQPATDLRSQLSMVTREVNATDGATVRVTNQGKGDLYAQVVLRGTPPIDTSSAQESGLRLQVNYKGADGASLDPTSLRQGTDFVAEVTVANPGTQGDYHQLALTQVVPSGWEIINTRLSGTDSLYAQSAYDYRDIRDDRVLTYFSLDAGERKTFTVLLNAAYVGQFYQPAIYAEAMYDNTINGKTASNYVEVVTF